MLEIDVYILRFRSVPLAKITLRTARRMSAVMLILTNVLIFWCSENENWYLTKFFWMLLSFQCITFPLFLCISLNDCYITYSTKNSKFSVLSSLESLENNIVYRFRYDWKFVVIHFIKNNFFKQTEKLKNTHRSLACLAWDAGDDCSGTPP